MATNADAGDFTSNSPTISRLNRPTQELVLAARRGRGLLLRAVIADLTHKVTLAFQGACRTRDTLAGRP